jgi:hypothetical protein
MNFITKGPSHTMTVLLLIFFFPYDLIKEELQMDTIRQYMPLISSGYAMVEVNKFLNVKLQMFGTDFEKAVYATACVFNPRATTKHSL